MILKQLIELSDCAYKDFQAPLIPSVCRERILGVRIPDLRTLAKELNGSSYAQDFIDDLPHKFYDENNLHAFLIEKIKDFDTLIYETERFLPFVDNWATCDSFNPIAFSRSPKRLLPYIYKWLNSDHEYTVRYAIKLLMTYFLDDLFEPEYLQTVASINREEYYIKMMIAWYFATALTKQYKSAVVYIENKVLPMWIHNKTIQKALDSVRIEPQVKNYLKKFRIKA